jgi:hypothetical protein
MLYKSPVQSLTLSVVRVISACTKGGEETIPALYTQYPPLHLLAL